MLLPNPILQGRSAVTAMPMFSEWTEKEKKVIFGGLPPFWFL
jgi:hypothetical protein